MDLERIHARTVGICPICKSRGTVRRGPLTSQCSCVIEYHNQVKYLKAGIPIQYWEKNWDDYSNPDRDLVQMTKIYATNADINHRKGVGLFYYGGFGVGKTGLLCEVVKQILRETNFTVSFQFFPDLMAKLSAFDTTTPEERREIERVLLDIDFLILDDVGREYRKEGSNWVGANIDSYFRKRMNQNLPVLMSSNFSIKTMQRFYGESVGSVFRGTLVEKEFDGEDYRPTELEKRLES